MARAGTGTGPLMGGCCLSFVLHNFLIFSVYISNLQCIVMLIDKWDFNTTSVPKQVEFCVQFK